jgi:hypothetical protein
MMLEWLRGFGRIHDGSPFVRSYEKCGEDARNVAGARDYVSVAHPPGS